MTVSEKSDNEKKVDTDWKESVAREREAPERRKDRATQQGEVTAPEEPNRKRTRRALPKPTLSLFVSSLASQVYIFLGDIENPLTGKQAKDLEQAKYTIDMIQVLKDKTRGNVSEDEAKLLDALLFELRMRYVNAAGK